MKPLVLAASFLCAVCTAVAFGLSAFAKEPVVQTTSAAAAIPVEGWLPSLEGANGWVHSEPLTPAMLRGKVVLVDFWTYTCINWQRTEPYVRAWAEKYRDSGLVVIGVHTPEFEFEKLPDNVRAGIEAFRVGYPVAIDNDYAIWRAFDNRYWPAIYIADANGRVRYHQFGEGAYARTEAVIRQLLREAGHPPAGDDVARPDARGSEVAADWENLRSGENYLGAGRSDGFVSVTDLGRRRGDHDPRTALRRNEWTLVGDWTIRPDAVALEKPGGRIVYRFHARDVHLVMGPPMPGAAVHFRVLLDGHRPGRDHGTDIDDAGNGTATGQRLYQLIRQSGPIADRVIEIKFLDPGIDAYVFTFG